MRVWVTRAQPGADATAARLRALGHDPVVEPVLRIRPLAGVRLDLEGIDALAFTSANAVTAFAALSDRRDRRVFAVGEATAAAARAAGFAAVDSADGDVRTLAAHIAASGFEGTVLHPGATEPAGDLAAAGLSVRAVPVYETAATGVPPPAEIDAVLVHSPKAARIVARLLAGTRAEPVEAFALSAACAAPLKGCGFRRLSVAPYPNETALLTLLAS